MNSSVFSFKGRIKQKEYWNTIISAFLIALVFGFVLEMMLVSLKPEHPLILPLMGIASFVVLILSWIQFAASVKRLHDFGSSGAYALMILIPILNLVFLLYVGCTHGDADVNKYGENPQ